MFLTQSIVAAAGLGLGLLASSCDVSVRATPTSVAADFHGRTWSKLHHPMPAPCLEQYVGGFQDDNGKFTVLIDVNCDGVADYAQCGSRRWLIKPLGPRGVNHNWPTTPPNHLPYRDPGFGNRTALEWIEATGLDDLEADGPFSQQIWLHEISTTDWTLDVTIPSTSECHRPSFTDYDVGYQWNVLASETGPDFETWRVGGDLSEVLRFMVDCGALSTRIDTKLGELAIEVVQNGTAVVATLDGFQEYWIDLD